MLALLLLLILPPQGASPDLDAYLQGLASPGVQEVLESLGPAPDLEALLDPGRVARVQAEAQVVSNELSPEDQALLEEADSWSQKITKERRARNYRSAANWAARQATIRTELLGPDHPLVARSLSRIARSLLAGRRYSDSAKTALAALEINLASHGRVNLQVRINLVRLADSVSKSGDIKNAAALQRHALDIVLDLTGSNDAWVGSLSGTLATSLAELGEFEASEALYRRAVEVYEEVKGPDSVQVAAALNNLAQGLMNSRKKAQAFPLIERALEIYRTRDKMKTDGAIACLNLLGKESAHAEALEYFAEAYDLADGVLSTNNPMRAALLSSYGWQLVISRDLPHAEELLLEALEINTRIYGRESYPVATNLNNLAGLMRVKGQFEAALVLFEESFELQRRYYPPTHPALIVGWSNLGTLYYNVGRDDKAETTWETGLALAEEVSPGDYPETALMLANLGSLLHSQARLEEASEVLTRSLEMRRRLKSKRLAVADTAGWLAMVLESQGELDEAERLGREALEAHRASWAKGGTAVAGDLDVLTRVLFRKGKFEEALETSREAFALIDAQRTNMTGDAADRALYAQSMSHGKLAAQHIQCALETGHLEEAFSTFERARGRVLLDLVTGEAKTPTEWAGALSSAPAAIRDRLESTERIRAYFWAEDSLTLFNVDNTQVEAEALLAGAEAMEQLERDVLEYVRRLSDPRDRNPGRQAELRASLSELLWPRVRSSTQRWVILPDGPLHGLPFETLAPSAENASEFVYSSSGTLYQNRCRVAREQSSDLSLLALGAAEFEHSSGLAPLPATRSEVEKACELVRAAGGTARALLGKEATLSALQQEAPGCSILHLATHGHPGSDRRPYKAALALSAENGDEAELSLGDLIAGWHGELENCGLVVLSACDTQRTTRVGDSLMALSWGFFYSGSPSVLASLWKVDDRATALLMLRFYENLLGDEPLSKLGALSEAKRWLSTASRSEIRTAERRLGLDGSSSSRSSAATEVAPFDAHLLVPYSDPAFWAGFILLGSPE